MADKLFILWLFVLIGRPQDFFQFLEPLRPALLLTLLNIVALPISGKLNFSILFRQKIAKHYLLFFMVMLVGIPFAVHKRTAFESTLMEYMLNILFFVVLIMRTDTLQKIKSIIFTLCGSLLLYGVFSFVKGEFYDGRLQVGHMFDPNDLAFFCVSLIPFSIYIFFRGKGIVQKSMGIGATLLGISVAILTGSRGGLLGLMAIICMFIFGKNQLIQKKHKTLIIIVFSISVVFFASKAVMDRLSSMTNLQTDYNITSESGRIGIWKRGITLYLRNPILGVGMNCFGNAIGYLRGEQGVSPIWQAPHNSYVQVMVELGTVGMIFYILIIKRCLEVSASIVKTVPKNRQNDDELVLVTSFTTIAFIGQLVSIFFLTQAYSIIFTLFIGLYASINSVSKDSMKIEMEMDKKSI